MIRLYLDFDGTITTNDTGDGFFQHFGDWNTWIVKLMNNELNVREYYRGVCSTLRRDISSDDVSEWASHQSVDSGLHTLLRVCREFDVQVFVVSDGFRNYIDILLRQLPEEDRSTIRAVFANYIELESRTPVFPGATESCRCFCASCKRNTVITTGSDDDLIVYVGDGSSDICAAQHADVVFAKQQLARWMHDNHWPHHPWRSLHDVAILLQKHCKTSMWKKRRIATLARKNAVEGE